MDFGAQSNAAAYSGRSAHPSWAEAIRDLVDPADKHVVDIGCGGGIYSRAWLDLGAASVTGVDSSGPILESARHAGDDVRAAFVLGDASATGLAADSADVVFARALVHHVEDLAAFAHEAVRIVRPGGRIIIQDRTIEDVEQPAGTDHLRGYFFDLFPRLLEVERSRRPGQAAMAEALRAASDHPVQVHQRWEVRTQYPTKAHLLEDLRSRKGRSILHELDDEEVEALSRHIAERVPQSQIQESDRWTFWMSVA